MGSLSLTPLLDRLGLVGRKLFTFMVRSALVPALGVRSIWMITSVPYGYLIRAKGGSVTPRDLMRSSRRYPKSEDAKRALDDLVAAGLGRLESVQAGSKGGRPTVVFVLSTDATKRNPDSSGLRGEKQGFRYVADPDAPEMEGK